MKTHVLYPYLNLIGLAYLSYIPGDMMQTIVSLLTSKLNADPSDKHVKEALTIAITSMNALNEYSIDHEYVNHEYEFINYCKARVPETAIDASVKQYILTDEPIIGLYEITTQQYFMFVDDEDDALIATLKHGTSMDRIRMVYMNRFDWVKVKLEVSLKF